MTPEDYEREHLMKLRQGKIKVRFSKKTQHHQVFPQQTFFDASTEYMMEAWWEAIPMSRKDASNMAVDKQTFQTIYALMLCILVPDGNVYARDTKIASWWKSSYAHHPDYVDRYEFYYFLYHFSKYWLDTKQLDEAHFFLQIMLRECMVISQETGMGCLQQNEEEKKEKLVLPPLIHSLTKQDTTSDVIQPYQDQQQLLNEQPTESKVINESQPAMKQLSKSLNTIIDLKKDYHGLINEATKVYQKLNHYQQQDRLPPIRGINLDEEIQIYRDYQRYTEPITRRGMPLL